MNMQKTQNSGDRPQIRAAVGAFLAQRQRLLVAFCRLAGVEPFTDKRAVASLLQEFCQQLMDYTALVHFELLEQLAGEGSSSAEGGVLSELYPSLAENTELAVQFNDQFDSSDHVLDLDDLDQELSSIGEALAARFDLEDRAIRALVLP